MNVKRALGRCAPYFVCAALASLLAGVALRIWRATPDVPLAYSSDALPHAMHFQQLHGNAWYFTEPRLSAPFAQHFSDWPLPDLAHLLLAKFILFFTGDWATALNAMFFIGFPLAAVTALWVFKKFGISTAIAIALAVLYAVLPYHFVRGEVHLFLSLYYAVPLAVWLVVSVAEGKELITGRNLVTARNVAICAIVAWCGIYYAVFTLILLVAAVGLRMATTASLAPLRHALRVIVLVGVFTAATLIPVFVSIAMDGSNLAASERAPWDSDQFGLGILQLFLPVQGHVFGPAAALEDSYYSNFPIAGEHHSPALGIVGSFGALYLLGLIFVVLARKGRSLQSLPEVTYNALLLPLILVATVGGFGTYMSLLFSSPIRSWNRVSIFIAVFALAAVGLLADRAVRRMRFDVRKSTAVLATALLVVGTVDQVLPKWAPDYENMSNQFRSDQEFFASIEQRMPRDSAIYQVPRVDFPEGGAVGGIAPYDPLKGYLHTSHLRWSYGGIKGRLESDWQIRLANPQDPQFLRQLVSTGFAGVLLDRRGVGPDVEANLTSQLGEPVLQNDAGNLAFYELQDVADTVDAAERAQISRELLFRILPTRSRSLNPLTYGDEGYWWESLGPQGSFYLDNTGSTPTRARIEFEVSAAVQIMWPDGQSQTVEANQAVQKDMSIEPGRHEVLIAMTDGEPSSTFRVLNTDVMPL